MRRLPGLTEQDIPGPHGEFVDMQPLYDEATSASLKVGESLWNLYAAVMDEVEERLRDALKKADWKLTHGEAQALLDAIHQNAVTTLKSSIESIEMELGSVERAAVKKSGLIRSFEPEDHYIAVRGLG